MSLMLRVKRLRATMTYKIRDIDDEDEVIEVNQLLRITKGYYRGKYGSCEIATHHKGLGTFYFIVGAGTKYAPYFHESYVSLIAD